MALIHVNWRPDKRQLRWFGAGGAAVFGALAAWAAWRHSLAGVALPEPAARTIAIALACLAGLCGLLTCAAPKGLLPLYWFLTAAGLPVGLVASYLILGVVYFGVFTPIALVFRLIGRDALCRRLDRRAATYWITRRQAVDRLRHFRQF